MAGEEKSDRRARRTREALTEALMDLVLETPYDAISVQDIIDRADVGRSTFYAHYQDKEDLLAKSLEQVLDHFAWSVGDAVEGDRLMPTRRLFQHALEQKAMFLAMARKGNLDRLLERGQVYWRPRVEERLQALLPHGRQPELPLALLADYVTGTFRTMFQWYLANKLPYPPERMDELFHRLVAPGVYAMLGK